MVALEISSSASGRALTVSSVAACFCRGRLFADPLSRQCSALVAAAARSERGPRRSASRDIVRGGEATGCMRTTWSRKGCSSTAATRCTWASSSWSSARVSRRIAGTRSWDAPRISSCTTRSSSPRRRICGEIRRRVRRLLPQRAALVAALRRSWADTSRVRLPLGARVRQGIQRAAGLGAADSCSLASTT